MYFSSITQSFLTWALRKEPKGLRLDCELSLIFLLSHSSSRARVRGEWRRRKPRKKKKTRNCDGIFDLAICRFSRLLDWHLTQYHLLLLVRDWDCLLLKSGELIGNSCFTDMVILKYNKHVRGRPFFSSLRPSLSSSLQSIWISSLFRSPRVVLRKKRMTPCGLNVFKRFNSLNHHTITLL